jgi:hypothetical protein
MLYLQPLPGGGKRKNPIFHFFKVVDVNSRNEKGEIEDAHYQCSHGKHKIITIHAKAKGSAQCMFLTVGQPQLYSLFFIFSTGGGFKVSGPSNVPLI